MMFGSNPNDYEIKTELAVCCYGIATVFLAKHRPSGDLVAVKRFKMDKAGEENALIKVSVKSLLDSSVSHQDSISG